MIYKNTLLADAFAIVGTDASLRFTPTLDKAKETIANVISDIVYEELGGDDEFLYDEDGNELPDEEIVDKIDEILELGEENNLCYQDDDELWCYSGDEDGYGALLWNIYAIK